MKIAVSEALRLKNELGGIVNNLNYSINHASLATVKEDSQIISIEGEKSFTEVLAQLEKALGYSEELNNALANFNRENGIDSKVRSMHNSKLLLNVFSSALKKSKPTTTTRFENLGDGKRHAVKVEYIPLITSKQMKESIAASKKRMRDFQIEIENLNQKFITLTFEYSDVEALVD